MLDNTCGNDGGNCRRNSARRSSDDHTWGSSIEYSSYGLLHSSTDRRKSTSKYSGAKGAIDSFARIDDICEYDVAFGEWKHQCILYQVAPHLGLPHAFQENRYRHVLQRES